MKIHVLPNKMYLALEELSCIFVLLFISCHIISTRRRSRYKLLTVKFVLGLFTLGKVVFILSHLTVNVCYSFGIFVCCCATKI